MVLNHVSWLDIFAVYAAAPCLFVAKSEIRQWPLVGVLVARVGTGAPFPIGSNRSPISMPLNGELRLGINDDVFTDNSGFYTVRVIRAEPGPSRIIRGAIR